MKFIFRKKIDATAVATAVAETAATIEEHDRELHGHALAGPLDEAGLAAAFQVFLEMPFYKDEHEPLSGYAGRQATVLVISTSGGWCDIYYEGRTAAFEASVREACGEPQVGQEPGLVATLRAAGLTNRDALTSAAFRYQGRAWANAAVRRGESNPLRYQGAANEKAPRQAMVWALEGNLSIIARQSYEARIVLAGQETKLFKEERGSVLGGSAYEGPLPFRYAVYETADLGNERVPARWSRARKVLLETPPEKRADMARAAGLPPDYEWALLHHPIEW